ncbi:MAG: HD domain-containing protein [Candidatus Moraniibacteriota bacterium]|nr:MAG: HD domain-containing protein [Candidatus Moranbacteria bacterium]
MTTYETYFKDFIGRAEKLSAVKRYRAYDTMFYRTNLATHSKRVGWQTMALLAMLPDDIRQTLDQEKILLLAWVHDDHEIFAGDHQSASEWHMTRQQCTDQETKEAWAVEKTAKIFPHQLGRHVYHDLLAEAVRVDTIESQLVKLADKIEGCGEALHEIFGGNVGFTVEVKDPDHDYGKTNPIPPVYYGHYFDHLPKKLPLLEPWRAFLVPPLVSCHDNINFSELAALHTPHTRASLDIPIGFAPYDYWKATFLASGSEDEIHQLFVRAG